MTPKLIYSFFPMFILQRRKTTLPFGPYLAVGGVVAALAGAPIIHAYLTLGHRAPARAVLGTLNTRVPNWP